MKVFVTGGAGYIGSHTCKSLKSAGHEPVTFDNLSTGHADLVRWGPLERGDIADRARVVAVLRQWKCEAILHFAASAYVGESTEAPLKYYANNVSGSISLFEAARDCGIDRIVFSSSCAVYGVPKELPITEESPKVPINPYGRSKLMVEQILADAATAYGMRVTALRYFNAAGADPDGEIGENHDPETHLIPIILQVAKGVRPAVSVFGTDHPTADGTCVRDYVHVSDLADAHVLALERLPRQSGFTAYNLGTGRGWSVRQIIEAARDMTGRPIRTIEEPKRNGDPPTLIANPTLAEKALGWQARRSGLQGVLDSAWRWQESDRRH
ncbi:MAG: UDP-glucose 4-epimerase GalE [Cucumibacter sp.]